MNVGNFAQDLMRSFIIFILYHIVACRPVTGQQPREEQIYNGLADKHVLTATV
jgi:hypothetical protein